MFDDVKYLIEKTTLPESVKTSLSVLTRAISWLPWVFIGIGLLLKLEYFIYWLGFFIFIEGLLFIALVYTLIQSIKCEIGDSEIKKTNSTIKSTLKEGIIKGVLGNVFFYLIFIVLFVILKAMGIIDKLIKLIFQTVA